MRKRIPTMAALLALACGSAACAGETDVPLPDEGVDPIAQVAEAEDELLLTQPFIFGAGLDACVPSLSIGIRTAAPLGFIAIDGIAASNLALGISMVDALGVVTPLDITPLPINAALLATIRAGLATTPFLSTPFVAPALDLGSIATLLPSTLQTQLASLVGSTSASLAAVQAGLQIALNPAITENALVFTGLPAVTGLTTFLIDASLTGLTAGTIARLSVFSALAEAQAEATAAAVRSAMFTVPFFSTCTGLIRPLPIVSPLL